MTLLLTALWPGLAGATVLGLAVGWLAGWPERPGIPLGLLGLAAGLAALAVSGLVPGGAGLWLDSACALVAAYGAGCALGALARGLGARG